jgi:RHS repeat-associated protein
MVHLSRSSRFLYRVLTTAVIISLMVSSMPVATISAAPANTVPSSRETQTLDDVVHDGSAVQNRHVSTTNEVESIREPSTDVAATVVDVQAVAYDTQTAPTAAVSAATFPLGTGWQLISNPEQPTDTSPAAVLASIAGSYDLVSAYDACDSTDPWKDYDPDSPTTSDLTDIDHTMGIWVRMTAPVVFSSAGTLRTSTDIPLCIGWNLIGYPLDVAQPITSALTSIAGKYTRVFGYDAYELSDPWAVFSLGVPAWANDISHMEPGKGYWVYATENTTLTISRPAAPPAISFDAPEGMTVTKPISITGAIAAGSIANWILEYRMQDDDTWLVIATGNTALESTFAGSFDPTLLLNGLFEIRLTATDNANQTTAESLNVVVEGEMKIGNFTFSLVDLAVPVSGIPIQVIRTYDSRDKRVGDFGVGWTLDIRDVRMQSNRPVGADWIGTRSGDFIPTYCLEPAKLHLLTVTHTDGTVYKFKPVVTPRCQALFPIETVSVSYEPLPGTNASLTALVDATARVEGSYPGEAELQDLLGQGVLDPALYELTLRDGTKLELNRRGGLRSITDLNNNKLTVSSAGITHSSGKGISFTRDTQGRITHITDPLGNLLGYGYNASGDLNGVTDQEGRLTQLTYDSKHNLTRIIDPRGIEVAVNEYTQDNRLAAIEDADGNRLVFTHDLDNQREVVLDRLGNETIYEYNARGDVTKQVDALGNVTTMTYDTNGNELSRTDALGRQAVQTFDANDNLLTRIDEDGYLTTLTYNSRNQLLTVTDARGRVIQNGYDSRGNLTSSTDGEGFVTAYTYSAAGNLLTSRDPLGNVISRMYDIYGNQTTVTDPLGSVTTMMYDVNNRLTSETRVNTLSDASQETITVQYTYDRKGNIVSDIDPDGNIFTINNNTLDKPATVVNKLGAITTYQYDSRGYLVRTIDADAVERSYAYDAEGRELSSTDADGNVTRYDYDALGRRIAETAPDGAIQRTGFDAVGRVITQTDALGNVTRIAYTAGAVTTTNALGQVSVKLLDSDGNVTANIDTAGNTTQFIYDKGSQRHGEGRLVETRYADGTSTHIGYDALGRVISQTDQVGITTNFGYDALGRLNEVRDALGNVTRYGFDALGRQSAQTDSNGHTTRFEYDRLGRLIRRILPLGQSESFTYDANGNVRSHTNFNGETISFTYDVRGQLVAKTWPDGKIETFAYTPDGLRLQAGDDSYTYDAKGHLISEIKARGHVITYTYDLAGNRTAVETSAGVTRYTYDALNRMASITAPDGGTTTYAYDSVGNLSATTLPNGIVTTYDYDALHRVTQVESRRGNGDLVASYAYTLDATGRRTQVVEGHSGRTVRYDYDALYRLISETVTDPINGTNIISYTYDAVGNRLTKTDSVAGPTTYIYDSNDRLLIENEPDGPSHYSYDSNGSLVLKEGPNETISYVYDAQRRLVSIQDDVSQVLYEYDADGLRNGRVVSGEDGVYYVTDKNTAIPTVLWEADASGSSLRSYVYGLDIVSQYDVASGTAYALLDGAGTIRQITNPNGSVIDIETLDAFGNLASIPSPTPVSRSYRGEEFDSFAKAYYLRARFYAPDIGRFMTMDSADGFADYPITQNMYIYSFADPVNYVDPTGYMGIRDWFLNLFRLLGNGIRDTVDAVQGLGGNRANTLPSYSMAQLWHAHKVANRLTMQANSSWQISYFRYFDPVPSPRGKSLQADRWRQVRSTWEKTLNGFYDPSGITYVKDPTRCEESEYANVLSVGADPFTGYKIFLCGQYFKSSVEQQALTIVHEMTHLFAETDDVDQDTLTLSVCKPQLAVKNAYNYELQAADPTNSRERRISTELFAKFCN